MSNKEAFEFIVELFNKKGEPPFAAPYSQAFDYLVSEGIVKPLEQRKSRFHPKPSKRLAVEKHLIKNC